MASALYRLGRWSFVHRRRVLAAWLVLLAGVAVLAVAVKKPTSDSFTVPGTQSQMALNLLNTRFPGAGGTQAQVVFSVPPGRSLTGRSERRAVEATLARVRSDPQVIFVSNPYRTHGVSANGQIAYGTVGYPVQVADVTTRAKEALLDSGGPAKAAGIDVNYGGEVVAANTQSNPGAIGVVVAFIVLMVTFGSVVAGGLPLLTALIGVAISFLGIAALTAVISESNTAPILALMIGLAVGIDYALFISTRYRQELVKGTDPEESAARAVATAGSAVCFAGTTVLIALAALSVVSIPFLTVMGLCAAGAVLLAVAVAQTLVPALLGFAGPRVITGRWAQHQLAKAAAPAYRPMSRHWVERVTRRPIPVLLAGVAVLIVVASPARHLRLALPDAGTHPKAQTDRRAYDLLTKGFGPGFNGPLLVVVVAPRRDNPRLVANTLERRAKAAPDVAAVSAPAQNPARDITLVQVVPKTGPTAPATSTLVHRIRSEADQIKKRTGIEVLVTGQTAMNIDTSSKLSSALPVYGAVVVVLCLLLLTLVFRSVLVPLKAVVGYLLSVVAALGAVTFVFQDGHFATALAVTKPSPIVSFLPILLMGILFGLAMDYEVFLVSRMREAFVRTDDAKRSVSDGYVNSARVVTAAGLIMISVFAGFVFSKDPTIKPIGFSLAFGVFVDAFIVRMTLVPAAMTLFGRVAWWLPSGLDRAIPDLDIEGEALSAPRATGLTA